MKVSPRLRREWDAKLRASGFRDLESPSGLLSSRGTVTFGDDAKHVTPEELAESELYYEHARDVTRSYRFPTRVDRQVWALHAERIKDADISTQLGISYRQARQSVRRTFAAVKERGEREVNQVNQVNQSAAKKLDAWVRNLDVELLTALVGRLA